MNRKEMNKRIAEETMRILKEGGYTLKNKQIKIKDQLEYSVVNSNLYGPGNIAVRDDNENHAFSTRIEVSNETTLSAIRKLLSKTNNKVLALNFASAKNPGGGFLNGSMAQEESLAIASGLYPTIAQMTEMYNANAKCGTALYTDYMVYSPNVPVFRDDKHNLLETPYLCSFITAPAVNAGVVVEKEKQNIGKINNTMKSRIAKILVIALDKGYTNIVLGAFGCGVFKNKPQAVASYFKQVLLDPQFKNKFENITFAVFDKTPNQEVFKQFKYVLTPGR